MASSLSFFNYFSNAYKSISTKFSDLSSNFKLSKTPAEYQKLANYNYNLANYNYNIMTHAKRDISSDFKNSTDDIYNGFDDASNAVTACCAGIVAGECLQVLSFTVLGTALESLSYMSLSIAASNPVVFILGCVATELAFSGNLVKLLGDIVVTTNHGEKMVYHHVAAKFNTVKYYLAREVIKFNHFFEDSSQDSSGDISGNSNADHGDTGVIGGNFDHNFVEL